MATIPPTVRARSPVATPVATRNCRSPLWATEQVQRPRVQPGQPRRVPDQPAEDGGDEEATAAATGAHGGASEADGRCGGGSAATGSVTPDHGIGVPARCPLRPTDRKISVSGRSANYKPSKSSSCPDLPSASRRAGMAATAAATRLPSPARRRAARAALTRLRPGRWCGRRGPRAPGGWPCRRRRLRGPGRRRRTAAGAPTGRGGPGGPGRGRRRPRPARPAPLSSGRPTARGRCRRCFQAEAMASVLVLEAAAGQRPAAAASKTARARPASTASSSGSPPPVASIGRASATVTSSLAASVRNSP